MGVKKLTVRNCQLCNDEGRVLLWEDDCCRIVSVADNNYPGFCRVILHDHIGEMTELEPRRRARLMQAVFATESALRELMTPDKINLASFGNLVPHLHWHVIPRFRDDRHFPNPVWGEVLRHEARARAAPDSETLSAWLRRALRPPIHT